MIVLRLLLAWMFLALPAGAVEPSVFRVFEGRPVSRVEIEGLQKTREYVVRRELATTPGAPFRVETLNADLSRLDDLGIFSNTDVAAAALGDSLVITLRVSELPPVLPLLDFSITDEDGLSLGPAASASNLFGRDISLSGAVLVGGRTQFHVAFAYPWIAWNHLGVEFSAARITRQDEILGFQEDTFEFHPALGLWLGRHGRFKAGFDFLDLRANEPGITLNPRDRDRIYGPRLALGWDTRNNRRNPSQGWHHELEVGYQGGDADFLRAELDLRRYQPFLTARSTLALGALASVRSGELGEDVPAYLAYRIGGANSIRGFAVEDLGAELFGKNQLLGTVEYRYLLRPIQPVRVFSWSLRLGLQAAVFADFGGAWSHGREFAWDRFKSGFGAGLRVLVPGSEMLRLDVGISEDGDAAVYVRGLSKFDAQRKRLR